MDLRFLEIIRTKEMCGNKICTRRNGAKHEKYKNLILYKNFENGKLFYNMAWIMENYENEYYNREDIEALLYECFNQLSELAVSHGFKGNLWHNFYCIYSGQ